MGLLFDEEWKEKFEIQKGKKILSRVKDLKVKKKDEDEKEKEKGCLEEIKKWENSKQGSWSIKIGRRDRHGKLRKKGKRMKWRKWGKTKKIV